MHRYFLFVLILCLLSGSALADKITVDPNTGGQAVEASESAEEIAYDPEKDRDPRMAQPVTYKAVQKRLFAIADDLTRMTGVAIRSGKNESDWRVRDIPLTIAVTDLPLGTLLRSIAFAAHVDVTSAEVNEEIKYRLYRPGKRGQIIDDYIAAQEQYQQAYKAWQWDIVERLPEILNSDLLSDAESQQWSADLASYMKLFQAVGPDYGKRIASGERIDLSPADLRGNSKQQLMDFLAAMDVKALANRKGSNSYYAPTGPMNILELTKSEICFHPVNTEWKPGICLDVSLTRDIRVPGQEESVASTTGTSYPLHYILPEQLQQNETLTRLRLPQQPQAPEEPPYAENMSDFRLQADLSVLRSKTIDLSHICDNPDDVTFGMLLVALADNAGLDIVAEDFVSHRIMMDIPKALLEPDVESSSVPERVTWNDWYASHDGSVLVGCAKSWYAKHAKLAPAAIIDNLYLKAATSGIELDDYLSIFNLSPKQVSFWLKDAKQFNHCHSFSLEYAVPWRFYASLSPGEQKLVKSENGLPLGILEEKKGYLELRDWLIKETDTLTDIEESCPLDLSDPAAFSKLVLRLNKSNLLYKCDKGGCSSMYYFEGDTIDGYLKKSTYGLDFLYPSGDKPKRIAGTPRISDDALPIYTYKRNKELLDMQKDKPLQN